MPVVYSGPILDALIELSEVKELRVTVTESFKGALLTGASAFAGGIVGGPVGLGIGGVIGACVASYQGQGKYKPLAHVILYDMTDEQKQRLAAKVQRAIENVRKEDVLLALTLLTQNTSLQQLVLKEVGSFVRDMGMRLV